MPSASIPAAIGLSSVAEAAGTAGLAAGVYGPVAVGSSILPTLATAASIGSTAIGAFGSIQSSQAAKAAAGYNAQIAENNAKTQTQNADFAGAVGEQNTAVAGAQTKARVGATLAAQGASGVDVNSGSAIDTRASEAKLGMLNELNIRSEAARQAYGYQTGAASATGQAALDKAQEGYDTTSGYLSAGSTVLGGIGKVSPYMKWLSSGGTASPLTSG